MRRAATLLVPVLLGAVMVAGCSGSDPGSDEPKPSPEERLADAKQALDATSGLTLSLEADRLPPGITALSAGEGVATHAPAFEGTLEVSFAGAPAEVQVVAVDGTVYAKLPFSQAFAEVNPAEYGAPDPAELMSTEGGLSSLLTDAEAVEEGRQTRDGAKVLTTFTGTLPGGSVASLVPSADPGSDFDAVFSLDDEDRLTRIELTGPFYPDAEELTYTVGLADYGTDRKIVAP